MEASELKERFESINEGGCMLKKCFGMLADASTKSATEFLTCYEGLHTYNNYLSECEATDIVNQFVNEDGTTGPKWSADALFAKVESLGGEIERVPYYNKWALWTAMNMEHSDHASVLKKWTDGDADKYAEACYDLAVGQLTDTDREKWIRNYFGV